MSQDLILSARGSRRWQAPAILAAAVAQIAFARLTDFAHIGQNVEVRSALAGHPLVPLGFAFAIWGAIYLYSLVGAVWQLGQRQRNNGALRTVGWNMAGIYLINALWQVWVPLRGFDIISVVMTGTALALGISGLIHLKSLNLSRRDEWLVAGPLALVTGWLTAAFTLNITSALVAAHNPVVNPIAVNISVAFLIGLIVVGAVVINATHSLLYSAALMWALLWVMLANIYRDHFLAMSSVALGGMVTVAAITAWQLYQNSHSGEPIHA